MATLTEKRGDFGVAISEANGFRSREEVTVAQDAVIYAAGTVMAIDTGEYVRFDGTNTAVAVLAGEVDAIAAAAPGTVWARDCELNGGELEWTGDGAAALSGGQITTGTGQLAAATIIVR